ncbi:helix-turn-helix domain-containing protein [Actinophytocola glycyrrhizae]|uniref:Helix-turn-helix domain-containing protein n=1 Tax=Actinophytocola glycyrrhizae TaxID=2044873 RepID=A0ABV9RZK0_9PSEU
MADPTGWFDQAQAPATDKARFEAADCGRLVAIVRAEEGWDHARLAGAAGVTETAVADFEAGNTSPVEPMLSTLLRAMGRTS